MGRLLFLLPTAMWAQTPVGSVHGFALDPTGFQITDLKVQLHSVERPPSSPASATIREDSSNLLRSSPAGTSSPRLRPDFARSCGRFESKLGRMWMRDSFDCRSNPTPR